MGIRRDGRATRSRGRQRLSAAVQGAAGDGADTACQVTDSPYRFNAISYWDRQAVLAIGYVVLDNPTMPIVGEGDAEPNDTDVPQLIADAQAAVDEVVRRGVTDRHRGAFLWRLHDRQPACAHTPVQGRHRAQRNVGDPAQAAVPAKH